MNERDGEASRRVLANRFREALKLRRWCNRWIFPSFYETQAVKAVKPVRFPEVDEMGKKWTKPARKWRLSTLQTTLFRNKKIHYFIHSRHRLHSSSLLVIIISMQLQMGRRGHRKKRFVTAWQSFQNPISVLGNNGRTYKHVKIEKYH